MCKKINIFLPCLLLFYVAASFGMSAFLYASGVNLPFWASCVISQSFLLLPCLIYVLVMRIHVVKCIPYRKMKPLDMLLCVLFGYALIPVVMLLNNITMLFSTNHLDSSSSVLASYQMCIRDSFTIKWV